MLKKKRKKLKLLLKKLLLLLLRKLLLKKPLQKRLLLKRLLQKKLLQKKLKINLRKIAKMSVEKAQELVAFIAVNLVDNPDDVAVQSAERDGEHVFLLTVHQDDLGKVIGKGGQTARSIRSLLQAIGAGCDKQFALEIVDD